MIFENKNVSKYLKSFPIICIYHGNCADGFGAAYGVRNALGEDGIEYYPGVYQKEPPDVKGKIVIMVDFSYKPEVVDRMANDAVSILILDHHKTAIEAFECFDTSRLHISLNKYSGNIDVNRYIENLQIDSYEGVRCGIYTYFNIEESGAMIAWKFFNPDVAPPKIIEVIQDRDLWKFDMPETRSVMAAIFSYPYNFMIWDGLIGKEKELFIEGEAIERKHFKDIDELVKVCQRRMVIGGYPTLVASLPYTFSSDAGHQMADGEYFAACYWDTKDSRVFSLRSHKDGIDVSEIAKQYGGGGHKNAAGFSVPRDHELARS